MTHLLDTQPGQGWSNKAVSLLRSQDTGFGGSLPGDNVVSPQRGRVTHSTNVTKQSWYSRLCPGPRGHMGNDLIKYVMCQMEQTSHRQIEQVREIRKSEGQGWESDLKQRRQGKPHRKGDFGAET